MKKKHMIIAAILAVALILCIWYTRPRTVEQFCPAVDLGDCTEIRLSGFMEDGDMSEYDVKNVRLTPEDEAFGEIIEMLENRRFSVRIANLLPLGTKSHATEIGDFRWRMHFYFEDVEVPFGMGSGVVFGLYNFYGDMELNYIGEKSNVWRVTTPGKDAWLGEIRDILFYADEWAETESSPTDITSPTSGPSLEDLPDGDPDTPSYALYDIFRAEGDMIFTLSVGDESFNSYTVESRWYADRLDVLVECFEWLEVEAPDVLPEDYLLTVESSNRVNKLSVWGGEEEIVRYDDGTAVRYWRPSPIYDEDSRFAYNVMWEYGNLDVDASRISFALEGNAEEAAEHFACEAYGTHLMSLVPGNEYGIKEYSVVNWSVKQLSDDGSAVVAGVSYAFVPIYEDSPAVWAGNTHEGEGEWAGKLIAYREFVLQKQDDDLWHCVDLGTGGARLPQ